MAARKARHNSKILAIDCSFGGHSVAIAQADEVIAQCHHPRIVATQGLITSIDSLLQQTSIHLDTLDCIVYGAGPGLFSGIRTACTVTQGLAYVQQLPVVPVPTTLALAQQYCRKHALVVYPAHYGHCYLATLQHDGKFWLAKLGPLLCPIANLPQLTGDWELCGVKLAKLRNKLRHAVNGTLTNSPSHRTSLAGTMAILGQQAFARGKSIRPQDARPLYVRTKVAYTKTERLRMHAK